MNREQMKQFLKDNGHVLIHMAEQDTLIKALCKIMSEENLRTRVSNFYQTDQLANIHFEYYLLPDEDKIEILEHVREKLKMK